MAKHTCAPPAASPPPTLQVWLTERLRAAAVSETLILSVNASFRPDGGSLWPLRLDFVLKRCVIRGPGPCERGPHRESLKAAHWNSVVLLCRSSVVFGKQADDSTLSVHVCADISWSTPPMTPLLVGVPLSWDGLFDDPYGCHMRDVISSTAQSSKWGR